VAVAAAAAVERLNSIHEIFPSIQQKEIISLENIHYLTLQSTQKRD
jgi:hypothetical protein